MPINRKRMKMLGESINFRVISRFNDLCFWRISSQSPALVSQLMEFFWEKMALLQLHRLGLFCKKIIRKLSFKKSKNLEWRSISTLKYWQLTFPRKTREQKSIPWLLQFLACDSLLKIEKESLGTEKLNAWKFRSSSEYLLNKSRFLSWFTNIPQILVAQSIPRIPKILQYIYNKLKF